MEFERIAQRVRGLRWLTEKQGKMLFDLVTKNNIQNILELGFYHGVSTVYMAGALKNKSAKGKVTTLDRLECQQLSPNVDALARDLGLEEFVNPVYSEESYLWELKKLLENIPRPSFDLIFIDGSHLWKTDALAFFLCDKMLNEGGTIVFDDLKWTMGKDADPAANDWVEKYTKEQRNTPQIQNVFDLLVKEHPSYGEFREEDGFGFAVKIKADQINLPKENIIVKPFIVTREMLSEIIKREK
jgi:predicted O-methyltransferase YrrM